MASYFSRLAALNRSGRLYMHTTTTTELSEEERREQEQENEEVAPQRIREQIRREIEL